MNKFDIPTVDVNIEEFYANNATENLNLTSPNIYSYFNDLYYIDVGEHIEKKNVQEQINGYILLEIV